MYLILEGDDAVYMGKVVALVRGADGTGGTKIVMRDGGVRTSGFTPQTIDRRSKNFWKEQREACLTKRS